VTEFSDQLSIIFFFLILLCRFRAAPWLLRYQLLLVLIIFSVYDAHCSCPALLTISLFSVLAVGLAGVLCRLVSGLAPAIQILVRPLEIYVGRYLYLYDCTRPFFLFPNMIFKEFDVVFTYCRGEQLT
jgi:hypothetical protein